jgi:hypothetical protein
VYPLLPLSLDCSFLIVPASCVPNVAIISGLFIIDCPAEIMATLGTQDTGAIKNEQSRDDGNIWVQKKQGKSRRNNPEIMATLGTQDTGTIKNEQSRDDGNIGYTRHRDNQVLITPLVFSNVNFQTQICNQSDKYHYTVL